MDNCKDALDVLCNCISRFENACMFWVFKESKNLCKLSEYELYFFNYYRSMTVITIHTSVTIQRIDFNLNSKFVFVKFDFHIKFQILSFHVLFLSRGGCSVDFGVFSDRTEIINFLKI